MGVCLTWFAIRGKNPEVVCAELGLHKTGQQLVSPWPQIAATKLGGGWYLVQRPNYECRKDEIPSQLSVGGEVLMLFVEEHVMFACLSCWKDGKRIWSVLHNSEAGEHHLEADGDLPLEFPLIRGEVEARIEQLPFFEIPCGLAAKLVGYRYDGPNEEPSIFEVLVRPPWWKRLFQR